MVNDGKCRKKYGNSLERHDAYENGKGAKTKEMP
jgi:hypothetical protein